MPDRERDAAQAVAVLFVCMGNICRSPTAEGVFLRKVVEAGLAGRIRVDSAGTHSYHIGHAPDPRSRSAALARGYDLGALRARQVNEQDFAAFDHILAMDEDNLAELRDVAPRRFRDKAHLFMDYSEKWHGIEVPDPYSGGVSGFEHVLDMIEDASAGLLAHIKKELGMQPSSS